MAGAIFLEGEKICLRTIEEEDLEFWRDSTNNPSIWRSMLHNKPYNLEELRDRFENISSSDDIYLMICDENEPKGIIWAHEPNSNLGRTEIALWIKSEFHGEGYGTEAVRIFTTYLFEQLRLHKVVARSYDFNEASRKLWNKVGFKEEAVLEEEYYVNGRYCDIYYFGVTEDEWAG